MPETVQIPGTIEEATVHLDALGRLLYAREWEHAAIVAAFVRLGEGQGTSSATGRGCESARTFADRGITGLHSTSTVTRYVKAWLDEHEGNYPRPGSTRRLPTGEWPPTRTGTDGWSTPEGRTHAIERIVAQHGPDAVARMVVANPAVEPVLYAAQIDAGIQRTDGGHEFHRRTLDEGEEQGQRIQDAIDQGDTAVERTGLAEHALNSDLRMARMHLRSAVQHWERNPYLTADQTARRDEVLAEVDHLLRLLRGQATDWSDGDRAFLLDLGIEGSMA